jgi:LPXTG-motif cell wall-anchored protein
MQRSLIALATAAAFAAGASPAAGKAGLELLSPPEDVVAGEPTPVRVVLMREPRRPTAQPVAEAGVRIRVELVDITTGRSRHFRSPATNAHGVAAMRLVFPTAGRWMVYLGARHRRIEAGDVIVPAAHPAASGAGDRLQARRSAAVIAGDGGVGSWPWFTGGGVALLLGGVWLRRRRRRGLT